MRDPFITAFFRKFMALNIIGKLFGSLNVTMTASSEITITR